MKDDTKSRKAALAAHLNAAIMTLRLRSGDDLDEAQLSEAFGRRARAGQ